MDEPAGKMGYLIYTAGIASEFPPAGNYQAVASDCDRFQANEARNSEVREAYTSVYTDENGVEQIAKFRRIFGVEGQAVIGNVSLQGEYAFMQNPQNNLFSTKEHSINALPYFR